MKYIIILLLSVCTLSMFAQTATVSMDNVAEGSTYPVGTNLTINTSGTANGTVFQNVRMRIGIDGGTPVQGQSINLSNSATFSEDFDGTTNPELTNMQAGEYLLQLVARTTDQINGNFNTVEQKTITIGGAANMAPTVNITAPSEGQVFSSGTPITITATASDDGSVTAVRFFINGTLEDTDNAAPYETTYNPVGDGTYTIRAEVEDNTGLIGEDNSTFIVGAASDFIWITPDTEGKQYVFGTNPDVQVQFNNLNIGEAYAARLNVNGNGAAITRQDFTATSTSETIFWDGDSYSPLQGLSVGTHQYQVALTQNPGGDVIEPRPIRNIEIIPQPAGGGGATVDSECEVVVRKGVPEIIGINPNNITAYIYENGWQQVPVQIDEKVVLPIHSPYNKFQNPFNCDGQTDVSTAENWFVEFYADANTYVGADTDPLYDANDELVLRYSDRGNLSDGTVPSGVDRIVARIDLSNPAIVGTQGYIYLFEDTSSPDPSAGVNAVDYSFQFNNNNTSGFVGANQYKNSYNVCNGAGLTTENSTIVSTNYTIGFSGRTIQDELRINRDVTKGLDVLDRNESTNFNNRSTQTYNDPPANGAFICNKNGPIRAIRSVMGSNSGTYNQLDMLFTSCYVEEINYYRVHSTTFSIWSYLDLASNITGLHSRSNRTTKIDIDGVDDGVDTYTLPQWDFVETNEGNIISLYDIERSRQQFQFTQEGYYKDDDSFNPNAGLAVGIRGGTGFKITTADCYDPTYNSFDCDNVTVANVPLLTTTRRNYYEPVTTVQDDATERRSQFDNPVQMTSISQTVVNSVDITSPDEGDVYPIGTSLAVDVTAADNDGITQIELFVSYNSGAFVSNGVIPASGNNFSTVFQPAVVTPNDSDLTNMQQGSYTIRAVMTDGNNNTVNDQVNITVANNNPPATTSSGFQNNGVYESGQTLTITVDATDDDGIDRVEFYVDNQLVKTDNTAPYTYELTGTTGTTNLRTITYDNTGNSTTEDFTLNFSANVEGQRRVEVSELPQNSPNMAGKAGWYYTVGSDEKSVVFTQPMTPDGNGGGAPDNWGSQTVVSDASINGNGTIDNPLSVNEANLNLSDRYLDNVSSFQTGNTVTFDFNLNEGVNNASLQLNAGDNISITNNSDGEATISATAADGGVYDINRNGQNWAVSDNQFNQPTSFNGNGNNIAFTSNFGIINQALNINSGTVQLRTENTSTGANSFIQTLNLFGNPRVNFEASRGSDRASINLGENETLLDHSNGSSTESIRLDADNTGIEFSTSTSTSTDVTGYVWTSTNANGLGNWVEQNSEVQSLAVTGTTNKTITLTNTDGSTVTANFTDIDSGGSTGDGNDDNFVANMGLTNGILNVTRGGTGTSAFGGSINFTAAGFDTNVSDDFDGNWTSLTGNYDLSSSGGNVTGTIDVDAGTFTLTAPNSGGSNKYLNNIDLLMLGGVGNDGTMLFEDNNGQNLTSLIYTSTDNSVVFDEDDGKFDLRVNEDALVSSDANNLIQVRTDGLFVANTGGGGADGNNFISSATFNTSNGVLTGTGTGSAGFTVNLDGRYATTDTDVSSISLNNVGDLVVTEGTTTLSTKILSQDANQLLSRQADGGIGLTSVVDQFPNNSIVVGNFNNLAYFDHRNTYTLQLQHNYDNSNPISNGTLSEDLALSLMAQSDGGDELRLDHINVRVVKEVGSSCDLVLTYNGTDIYSINIPANNAGGNFYPSVLLSTNLGEFKWRVDNISGTVYNIYSTLLTTQRK